MNLRDIFQPIVILPVKDIVKAFDLKKEDLNLDAPKVLKPIGYDHGIVWVSSDGKPWYGFRGAFIEAATTPKGKKDVRLVLEEVDGNGDGVRRIGTSARLLIERITGEYAEASVIRRAGKFFGDKGRPEEFFKEVNGWREKLRWTPTRAAAARAYGA